MFRKAINPTDYPLMAHPYLTINTRSRSTEGLKNHPINRKLYERINQTLTIDNRYTQRPSTMYLKNIRQTVTNNNNGEFLSERNKIRQKNNSNMKRAIDKQNRNPNIKCLPSQKYNKPFNAPKVQRSLQSALNTQSIKYPRKNENKQNQRNPHNINAKFTKSIYYRQSK